MNRISVRSAAFALLVLFAVVLVFHLLVLTEVIPFDKAWGGRLKNREEMLVFELVSVAINIGMALVVLAKISRGPLRLSKKTVTVLLWIMAAVFALNTIGNLFAVNVWERSIATPLTLLSSILCYRLAVAKE